jgi:hypothetical protein
MTLLDDYEVPHKLSGTRAARALIAAAPPDLLRRTGVADLLFAVRAPRPLPFHSRPVRPT